MADQSGRGLRRARSQQRRIASTKKQIPDERGSRKWCRALIHCCSLQSIGHRVSAERTKEPGSSECKIHRRKVSNIRSAWLPADQHKNEFTVVEKTDDVIDPFALFHRTTAARLDHRDTSFLSLAAVAAAIMVIPSDLPTVLPGPGEQKDNPTAHQPKASKPTRCGAYEHVRGGLPAQAF